VNRRLRELLYRLRTEADTPGRQAGAVGLGVFIGCSPFYGFHLALSVILARLRAGWQSARAREMARREAEGAVVG